MSRSSSLSSLSPTIIKTNHKSSPLIFPQSSSVTHSPVMSMLDDKILQNHSSLHANATSTITSDLRPSTASATPQSSYSTPPSSGFRGKYTKISKPKKDSRSIFSNYKTTKSSGRLNVPDRSPALSQSPSVDATSAIVYQNANVPKSTPDLVIIDDDIAAESDYSSHQASHLAYTSRPKKSSAKHRFQILRSRSTKTDELYETASEPRSRPRTATNYPSSDNSRLFRYTPDSSSSKRSIPTEKDRSLREKMTSSIRNRSSDRHENSDELSSVPTKEFQELSVSTSSGKDSGSSFLANLRNSSTRAADGFGKASKFLNRLARSGIGHDRDAINEENYVCRIINLPLVEQTRKTRISKRLENSRDKTEFWMPALPWRCIDYLNAKGCDQEGLYRVPGSGREIKHWQMRFDRELDIDLFNETDLYDINIIGSMFKAWLRELPDEIFPKATQARIAEQCQGAKTTPQLLRDELSRLPPYNYYLLFAITCHISLLHSCSSENKMDYRNLCICFQPCMKIDAFCFQFLVLDWRNCWQGCWTEQQFLEQEKEWMRINRKETLPGIGGSGGGNYVVPPLSGSELNREKVVVSYQGNDINRIQLNASPNEEIRTASSQSYKPSISGSVITDNSQAKSLQTAESVANMSDSTSSGNSGGVCGGVSSGQSSHPQSHQSPSHFPSVNNFSQSSGGSGGKPRPTSSSYHHSQPKQSQPRHQLQYHRPSHQWGGSGESSDLLDQPNSDGTSLSLDDQCVFSTASKDKSDSGSPMSHSDTLLNTQNPSNPQDLSSDHEHSANSTPEKSAAVQFDIPSLSPMNPLSPIGPI